MIIIQLKKLSPNWERFDGMVYIRKNIIHKKCKYCGKKFKIRSANQLFCSQKCFKINRKNYKQRSDIKLKDALRAKTPARKKRRRKIAALPKNRKKKAKYAKKYKQRSYVREKRNEYSNSPKIRARKYKAQRKKKREARRRLGGKCFVCGTNRRLEFHHIKYTRSSKQNWNEVEVLKHPERFRLLCNKCHNVVTYALHEPKRTILVLTNLQKILKAIK